MLRRCIGMFARNVSSAPGQRIDRETKGFDQLIPQRIAHALSCWGVTAAASSAAAAPAKRTHQPQRRRSQRRQDVPRPPRPALCKPAHSPMIL